MSDVAAAAAPPPPAAGDVAWVLTGAALVFIMIPGLGYFYAGMARDKNALSLMLISLLSLAIVLLQCGGVNPWRAAIWAVFDGDRPTEQIGALCVVLAVLQAPAVPHAAFDALGIVPGRIAKARKLLAGLGATTGTAARDAARRGESVDQMQAAFRPPTPVESTAESTEAAERKAPGPRPMSPWRRLMADAPESPSADPPRDEQDDDASPNHAVYASIARILDRAAATGTADRTVLALTAALLLETRCVRDGTSSGSGPRTWTPLPLADAAPRASVQARVARAVRAYVAAHHVTCATATVADLGAVLADIGTLLDSRPGATVRAASEEQAAGTMLLAWHLLVAPLPAAPPPVVDPVAVAVAPVTPVAGLRRQSVHHHHRGAFVGERRAWGWRASRWRTDRCTRRRHPATAGGGGGRDDAERAWA
ncbi:hypothetical protein AMAG_20197 [Allomyces macrogynus ATCC 38327]|uniref:Ammonium transporter AmtB-like domain-containing protein n=1 Tax=Allomyces macrogynus (strain ATCC 38327) TaxID=578462 RepID=A0A0L0T8H6_ALLM3|nr:hypothetical protein AMAG_20197 [Allomyces macrogynus ATCC 38327]|eukprot:KNE70874.1 hypothetical protein AMAG_20197 [Allomyces macrogynus ATCC 38327]